VLSYTSRFYNKAFLSEMVVDPAFALRQIRTLFDIDLSAKLNYVDVAG